MKKDKMEWYDRKRWFCGLPFTFTKYGLGSDRFYQEKGLLNTVHSEVRLYRILDLTLRRNLIQKLFGLGTIKVNSSDKDMGTFDIINIKNSEDVAELLSQSVERERREARVSSREFMHDHDHDGYDGNDDFDDDGM